MGDMYRIDLSNLPAGEREKTKSMLEYADEVTLSRAMEERREIK